MVIDQKADLFWAHEEGGGRGTRMSSADGRRTFAVQPGAPPGMPARGQHTQTMRRPIDEHWLAGVRASLHQCATLSRLSPCSHLAVALPLAHRLLIFSGISCSR